MRLTRFEILQLNCSTLVNNHCKLYSSEAKLAKATPAASVAKSFVRQFREWNMQSHVDIAKNER